MEELKCKIHSKYKGIRHPKRTKNFPNGCEVCLKIYEIEKEIEDGRECEEEIWAEACRIAAKPD